MLTSYFNCVVLKFEEYVLKLELSKHTHSFLAGKRIWPKSNQALWNWEPRTWLFLVLGSLAALSSLFVSVGIELNDRSALQEPSSADCAGCSSITCNCLYIRAHHSSLIET